MASRGDINSNLLQPTLCERWLQIDVDETLEKAGKYTKLKSKDYFDAGKYPVIDQGDKFVSGFINDEKLLYQGDLPIIIFGDHTRNIKYVDFKFAAGADGTKILRPNKCFDPKFYFYYFKSLSIPDLGYSRHYALLKLIKFPLPPLTEQQRIVAKLDALFGQLETIKKSLENVPVLLKNFRQQVLTQAVTGKLTEEWREGKELEEWRTMSLVEFAAAKLGKMLDKNKNTGSPIGYIGNINVRWFEIDLKNLNSIKVQPTELQKYQLLDGDVLVCEGGEPGRAAIWKNQNENIIYQKALHRVRLNEKVTPSFFLYNLKNDSNNGVLKDLFSGTTIKHLTGKSFKKYKIDVPPPVEQQEIVRRVESLFAKADAIEAQYNTLKEKIDKLPQAILHKAFKGELTQQLDTDGDARDLLEAIEKLKAATPKTKKSKAYKTNTSLKKVAEPK